jgi:hypothetical protein
MSSKSKKTLPVPEPAPIYLSMRDHILSLVPTEAGITPSARPPYLWGVLTEMGLPNGWATLVALADGTTSLYLSGGGGFIGCGGHAAIAAATRALVAEAERHLEAMVPTADFPFPTAGRVRFYALTLAGKRTAEVGWKELEAGRHALAPLFYYSNEVVTQVRLHSQPAS